MFVFSLILAGVFRWLCYRISLIFTSNFFSPPANIYATLLFFDFFWKAFVGDDMHMFFSPIDWGKPNSWLRSEYSQYSFLRKKKFVSARYSQFFKNITKKILHLEKNNIQNSYQFVWIESNSLCHQKGLNVSMFWPSPIREVLRPQIEYFQFVEI